MEHSQNESPSSYVNGTTSNYEHALVDFLKSSGSMYRKSGDEYEIRECPFCHSGTDKPSNQWKLRVNCTKGVFNCFRCQAAGTIVEYLKDCPSSDVVSFQKTSQDRISLCNSIWESSHDLTDDGLCPATQYLKSRGLSASTLPLSIRSHDSLDYYDDRKDFSGRFPALVARVQSWDGTLVGLQRIYLTEEGNKISSLPGWHEAACKKALGRINGNAVHLCNSVDDTLALAEGVETGLAVREATALPTWACVSAGGLASVQIPRSVSRVYIWADNDASGVGQKSAVKLATRLQAENRQVYLLIPDLQLGDGQKGVDWLDIFNVSKDSLQQALAHASLFVKNDECTVQQDAERKSTWPKPVAEAAYYGLIGKIVRRISPHTEADSFALFLQLIALVGNVIGRSAHFRVEDTIHFLNLFVVIVGQTAKGRKGTSLDRILRLLRAASPDWFKNNITYCGFSSGEGVIHATRDPIYKLKKSKEDDQCGEPKMELVDQGVTDKRFTVVESEFVNVIKITSRDGNTLSALLRNAWDRGDLGTLTKNSPEKSTGAHITFIGHITVAELRRNLDQTDAVNGFGNRILWGAVTRSKLLPRGGTLKDSDVDDLIAELASALEIAKNIGQMTFDDPTWEQWDLVYPALTSDRPGLFGAMTARAEAQVARLSCIYAAIDKSPIIRGEHLKAALAIWQYCEDSCAHIFGGRLEDPHAQRILEALMVQKAGLSRTEIRDSVFAKKITAERMDQALEMLRTYGLAAPKKEISTGGRPSERWFYTPKV